MTKNDNLFDIKYVKFDACECTSLIGKEVFISDSLINLREAVNNMEITNPHYYGKLVIVNKDASQVAMFKIDCDDRTFKYLYYDPYYELKCALKRGDTIEHNFSGSLWEAVDDPVFDDKPEYYRIKNKPALKWQDLKIGDILRGPFMSINRSDDYIYGIVTMIDIDSNTDKHIHAGHFWIADDNICKFRRVNEHGEDME